MKKKQGVAEKVAKAREASKGDSLNVAHDPELLAVLRRVAWCRFRDARAAGWPCVDLQREYLRLAAAVQTRDPDEYLAERDRLWELYGGG